MGTLEILTTCLLAVESVLAVACGLVAVEALCKRRVVDRKRWAHGEQCVTDLRGLADSPQGCRDEYLAALRAVRDRAARHKSEDTLAAVLDRALNAPRGAFRLEDAVELAVAREDRGMLAMCAWLAKVAPLTGLGGMLAAASRALVAFSAGRSIEPFIQSFANALTCTFFGVMVAVLAVSTARRLWMPHLERLRLTLLERASLALSLLSAVAVRPKATRELIRQGVRIALECGVQGITLGHHDGAEFPMLRAVREAMETSKVVGPSESF
jgi:hypothetical protein